MSDRCDDCHAERRVDRRAPAELFTFARSAAAPWGVVVRQTAAEALPTEGAHPVVRRPGGAVLQLGLGRRVRLGRRAERDAAGRGAHDEAERIAGGELDWPIPDLGGDEVGRLGKSLDRMRRNLRRLIDAHRRGERRARGAGRGADQRLNDANDLLREREEAARASSCGR